MGLRELIKRVELDGIFSSSASQDPFEMAVATVLSQNTSDINALKAFDSLRGRLNGRITPQGILSLKVEDLEEAIASSGLKRNKAKALLNVAKAVSERWQGDIKGLLKEKDPRGALMSIKGVGPKTADVILLHLGYNETFAIDRHIERVVKRFGLVNQKDGYEIIRTKLMEEFPPEDRLMAHKLLIVIGRKHCRPNNPNCQACPLKDECKKSS